MGVNEAEVRQGPKVRHAISKHKFRTSSNSKTTDFILSLYSTSSHIGCAEKEYVVQMCIEIFLLFF